MERQLAKTILVDRIEKIPEANSVDLAKIGGWSTVVGKDTLKTGDVAVYFEIDSVLPSSGPYADIFANIFANRVKQVKNAAGEEIGWHLKTMKFFKGTILSQGLLLPLTSLSLPSDTPPGMDMTESIGVVKYEPLEDFSLHLRGDSAKGGWDPMIRKTDLERYQNIVFGEYVIDKDYEITVKIDGTSSQYGIRNGEYFVCSRNIKFKVETSENIYTSIGKDMSLNKILHKIRETLGYDFSIQGEIAGPKINGNLGKLMKFHYYMYNIWNIDEQKYIPTKDRLEIIKQINEMQNEMQTVVLMEHVPIVSTSYKLPIGVSPDMLQSMAIGYLDSVKKTSREGIVFKPTDGSAGMFKVVSNDYLLKSGN